MTEIENEYGETNSPEEKTKWEKSRSAMLRGWTNIKPLDNDEVLIFAKTKDCLEMAKSLYIKTDLDVDKAHLALTYALKKAGLPTEDADKVSRTAIGDVTGGKVPRSKLPAEIDEQLSSDDYANVLRQVFTPGSGIDNFEGRGNPGTHAAKIQAKPGQSGSSTGRTGTGNATYPTGKYPGDAGGYINPTNPEAQSLRGGDNPPNRLTTEQDRSTYATSQIYGGGKPGSEPGSRASQDPGQASVYYKFYQPGHPALNKSYQGPRLSSEPTVTLTKGVGVGEGIVVKDLRVERESTFLLKHAASALMNASEEDVALGRAITSDSIGQSFRGEDEALQRTGLPSGAAQMAEEDEMDEREEREFTRLEETADKLDMEARRAELEGDWQARDSLRETAKSYRANAMRSLEAIKARRGTKNLPTGM